LGIKSLLKILIKDMEPLLNSKQVMELLNIKSETTLIKYEREGLVKVARRFGNQKRYTVLHLAKLTGN
jgi:DNA-binding transcriptional MerR regulator